MPVAILLFSLLVISCCSNAGHNVDKKKPRGASASGVIFPGTSFKKQDGLSVSIESIETIKGDNNLSTGSKEFAQQKSWSVSPVISPADTDVSDDASDLDEFEDAVEVQPLQLSTLLGRRLDRNLPSMFARTQELLRQKEEIGIKAQTNDYITEGIKVDCRSFFQRCCTLKSQYCNFLEKYPEELTQLEEHAAGKSFTSPSSKAYYLMHQRIIYLLTDVAPLYPNTYKFKEDVVTSYMQHFSEGRAETNLLLPSPEIDIYQQLELYRLAFIMIENGLDDLTNNQLYADFAQYMSNCGIYLEGLCNRGFFVEEYIEKARIKASEINWLVDIVEDYMINEFFRNDEGGKCVFIGTSLRFTAFLRHPSVACGSLYHLNSMKVPPEATVQKNIMIQLTRLLGRIQLNDTVSLPNWSPYVASLFFMQSEGYLKDKMTSSEGVDLNDRLVKFKGIQTTNGSIYDESYFKLSAPLQCKRPVNPRKGSPFLSVKKKLLKLKQAKAAT